MATMKKIVEDKILVDPVVEEIVAPVVAKPETYKGSVILSSTNTRLGVEVKCANGCTYIVGT